MYRAEMRIATLALAALLLASCGGGSTADDPAGNPDGAPSFPTGSYAPEVQERIDSNAEKKDCAALQEDFDTADANENAGKADLLTYIDAKMKSADCY